MRASVECDRDFSEAWLTLRVDENTDITCDRIWRDEDISITSLSISNTADGTKPECELMPGGRTVRIKGTYRQRDIRHPARLRSPTATDGDCGHSHP